MEIPTPRTLREAVDVVIAQNKTQGYSPTRFAAAVSVADSELTKVCASLISSATALEALEKAIQSYPNLLFLEDLLATPESLPDWGFEPDVIDRARATTQWLNQLAGHQRWRC